MLQFFRICGEIDDEHEALTPIIETLPSGRKLKVTVKILLTMCDGKIFCFLTGTSPQQCPTCKSDLSQLTNEANIGKRAFKPKGAGLDHGMQPLHAYMKFTRHVLNLGYQKPVQRAIEQAKSRGRTVTVARKREIRLQKKKDVQRFYLKKGMRVDFPNQFGSGNTLNGNLCKRLFRDYQTLATVLDLEEDLLRRYW